MKYLLIFAPMIVAGLSMGVAAEENMVVNGGFEQDADGDKMADYWQFVGDEGVSVIWDLDEGFAGRFSQKIKCTRFRLLSSASHAMLAQKNTVQLVEGMWYRISFAAKQEEILSQVAKVGIVNMKTWRNCGLREPFQVTSQWKQFEFVFQATETILKDARLQFFYGSTGVLWLDEVRLEPSEPVVARFTEVVMPTAATNLLPNSSFECGISGWGSIADLPYGMGNLNLPVGEVDTTTARFDQSSFKIELTAETMPVFSFDSWLYRIPVRAPLLANRGWITVEPGVYYTLSAYMKADSSGWNGVLSVQQAFEESREKQVHLFTDWTRHTFTFQPKAEQIFVALGLDLAASGREAGTIWIDGVQLVKGIWPPAYEPRAAIEVGLETSQVGNIFPYGVTPAMEATICNRDRSADSIVLHAITTDFDDAVVHESTLTLTPESMPYGRPVSIQIDPGVRSKGFYRLHLSCDGAEVAMTRPLRFAVIEPYTKSDSLFGVNHPHPWPHLLDLSKQIGICWFRNWSLQWQNVEPEEGDFDFTRVDYQIDRLLERDLNVLPLLPFPSSNWSSSADPEVDDQGYVDAMAYMPRDLDEFATYVLETVRHYEGVLGIWEVLNEPIYSSYALPKDKGYTVSDYLQLLQVAYSTIKKADPEALVIGGMGGPEHALEFIDAGRLHSVDILNLHVFPGLTAPATYEEPLRRLRDRMRHIGSDIPIWLTEGAYYADDDKPFEPWKIAWLKLEPWSNTWLAPLDSEITASEWQVKLNTILLAYGVEKIFYHSGASSSLNSEWLQGIFYEWGAAPRKMLVVQSAMANLLSPPIRSLGAIESPDGLTAYGFESQGRTVLVAWAQEGAIARKVSLIGKPWQAVDLQGNELEPDIIWLAQRPTYFVTNRSMPTKLPW